MSARFPDTDLQNLWQNLETEKTDMSAEQIHRKAQEVLRKNRRDSMARFAFALMASVFCVVVLLTTRRMPVRVIAVLIIAMLLTGAVRRLYRAIKTGVPQFAQGATPWDSCLVFYRNELGKQQEFAAQPAWQMLVALLIIAWLIPDALRRSFTDPLRTVLPAVLFAAAGLIVLMAVRKLQARGVRGEIEALNTFEKESDGGGIDDITIND